MSGRGDVERDSRLLVNGGARPFSCSGYLRPSALTEAIQNVRGNLCPRQIRVDGVVIYCTLSLSSSKMMKSLYGSASLLPKSFIISKNFIFRKSRLGHNLLD
jgi:hypothetical protein